MKKYNHTIYASYLGYITQAIVNNLAPLLFLISPIVEACPSENKAAAMSLLHSFYCWGTVAVVGLSTLYLYLFGKENWFYLPILWAARGSAFPGYSAGVYFDLQKTKLRLCAK